MVKNSVDEWDTNADNNTDVGGINIAEFCPAANINNGMREMMAQIRSFYDQQAAEVEFFTTSHTAVVADRSKLLRFGVSTTLTLSLAATLGNGWWADVMASTGAVTLATSGSDTITHTYVPQGRIMRIFCDGTAFHIDSTPGNIIESVFTSGSQIDVTFSLPTTRYRSFKILLEGINPATDAFLFVRTSADNGGSFDSGASDYRWAYSGFEGGATVGDADSTDTEIRLSPEVGTTDRRSLSGTVTITNAALASTPTSVQLVSDSANGTGMTSIMTAGGRRNAEEVTTDVRLRWSGAVNFADGGRLTLIGDINRV